MLAAQLMKKGNYQVDQAAAVNSPFDSDQISGSGSSGWLGVILPTVLAVP